MKLMMRCWNYYWTVQYGLIYRYRPMYFFSTPHLFSIWNIDVYAQMELVMHLSCTTFTTDYSIIVLELFLSIVYYLLLEFCNSYWQVVKFLIIIIQVVYLPKAGDYFDIVHIVNIVNCVQCMWESEYLIVCAVSQKPFV